MDKTDNPRHKLDIRNAKEMGDTAENEYSDAVDNDGKGWLVRSSEHENSRKHFDFRFFTFATKLIFKDEVKSQGRSGPQRVWIQLHGKGKHHRGWLYGSADRLVFERHEEHGFFLFSRLLVKEFVEDNVDFESPIVYYPDRDNAWYRQYDRDQPDKKTSELLTSVRLSDLIRLPHDFLPKAKILTGWEYV